MFIGKRKFDIYNLCLMRFLVEEHIFFSFLHIVKNFSLQFS